MIGPSPFLLAARAIVDPSPNTPSLLAPSYSALQHWRVKALMKVRLKRCFDHVFCASIFKGHFQNNIIFILSKHLEYIDIIQNIQSIYQCDCAAKL